MHTTRPRRGIERKILGSILRVGIIPLAIGALVGYLTAQEGQTSAVRQSLLTAVQKTTAGLRIAEEARLRTIGAIAASPPVVEAFRPGPDGRPAILTSSDSHARFVSLLPQDEGLPDAERSVWSLYDEKGQLLISSRDPAPESVVMGRPEWPVAIEKPEFTDVHYIPAEKRYMAQAVAPVWAPGTKDKLGYLSELFDISPMLKYALGFDPYRNVTRPLEATYQVVYSDATGGMKASGLDSSSSPSKPVLREEAADPQLTERLRQSSSRPDSLNMRGYLVGGRPMNVFLAYDRLSEASDIYVVAFRSTASVSANLWMGMALAASICFALVLILCYSAYRNVHNNIVRPVMLLNEGAQIIGQGDLELKLKIGSGDEIEELASSFNKMALALKRNIRQLEESEEKYRNLVTSMRDGIFQTDPHGAIAFLNAAGYHIFGFASPEEAVGTSLQSLFVEPQDVTRFTTELRTRGFVERARVWMQRRDGRAIGVELSGNLVRDDTGRVIGIEGIFRDVTRRVRLEREVRERAERLSAINQIANVINSSLEVGRLFESLVVEVKKLVDFDYAELSLLNQAGDAFETRQLWPEREEEASHVCLASEEDGCPACWVARQRACLIMDDLDSSARAFAHTFPSGVRSCICVPLYATGKIIGTLNLGSNHSTAFSPHDEEVLEQMAPHVAVAIRNAQLLYNLQASLEEVTRAREKLHAANEELKTLDEMKTNLLSNVSHELRTPLVAIMGYTDMILNGKAGPLTDTQRDYLAISLRNIEKLVTLIENLLDFSRLHRGQEKLVFDTFDLVECARASLQIIQPLADSRQVVLELDAPSAPVFVEGDRGKIGQVFNNLLSNAAKFNRPGGRIVLEIRPSEDSVMAAVTDNGIGIPQEALDKIFTRFYQYDSSSTRKYGGTGIGLAIAQDIARLHGTRIEVISEVGKGSSFRFALPLKDSRRTAERSAAAVKAETSNTRLLVALITPDRTLTSQVRESLAPEGMDVIHAIDATGALALTRKYSPDCLLLDMEVEGNGHKTLDEILDDPDAALLPIVLLTNDDKTFERYQGLVATRVKREFRKSSLLSGIQYALSPERGSEEALPVREPVGNKILCVDDDPEILQFVARCLGAEGYTVDLCESGRVALTRVATREYGLVLLDIAMPDIDGLETCRRIRTDLSLMGVRVYLVTAKTLVDAERRVEEVGADGYLLKPFRAEELVDLVRDAGTVHPVHPA